MTMAAVLTTFLFSAIYYAATGIFFSDLHVPIAVFLNCEEGSAWACNELGILLTERYDNRRRAADVFARACDLRFSAGCGMS